MTTDANNNNSDSVPVTVVEPYRPPLSPASIKRVALSSKSFRVFGLDDPAWRNARRDWIRRRRGSSGPDANGGANSSNGVGVGGGGEDGSDSEYSDDEDGRDGENDGLGEAEEMALICDAVATALEDDAGGFGTAGFHVSKVESVTLRPDSAVYDADLVPCDAETRDPINPVSLFPADEETGEVNFNAGNDAFHLGELASGGGNGGYSSFKIRITVSRAKEGLAAKRYYDALFAKRRELEKEMENNEDDDPANFDVERWADDDEELSSLRQLALDARDNNLGGGEEGRQPLGYYVEFLLLEPHVRPEEHAIAPPFDLDKTQPASRPARTNFTSRLEEEETKRGDASDSAFQRDIYSSRQFSPGGTWEKVNAKAFTEIGLDVRKALVRVEFPVFPEGCKDKTFREVYQLNARLKSGSFATVCRGTHRATGRKIAVKCVLRKDLPPSDDAAIYDEVLILSTLRHSYICPLLDFFEERECYFLVMELMSGGDLFDRIGKRKSYTENDARDLCRKMLESVRYCHENSVAHCDMKPKNLLLVSDEDDVQMKLADFGFATRVYEPRSLTKQCGTPFFVAPEVLMRSPYDQQSDMWSCGVIMFLLLGGDLPFVGRSQKELFRNIVMGRYEFEEEGWAHVSEQAKDLVKKLLVTDPSKRLSSREAMAMPWMRQRGNLLAKNNLQYTSQRLKGFNARMKLRASMICVSSVVSMRMSIKSLGSLKSVASETSARSVSESNASAKRRPSFLTNLPDEGSDGEEES